MQSNPNKPHHGLEWISRKFRPIYINCNIENTRKTRREVELFIVTIQEIGLDNPRVMTRRTYGTNYSRGIKVIMKEKRIAKKR